MAKPGVVSERPRTLFATGIPPELEYVFSPEPSHAGLLFLATSDPLGQIAAACSGQEYSNIAFVSPSTASNGSRRIFWLDPWGTELNCVKETTLSEVLANPLVTKVGYRRVKDNVHAGKWGLAVAAEIALYKERAPRRNLRETVRQLLGFEKPEDTPLSVVAAVFETMGWELEETPPSIPGRPSPASVLSLWEARESPEEDLSRIFGRMFRSFRRPKSIFPQLITSDYFTEMQFLQCQKHAESVRLLHQRAAIDESTPLIKQILAIIIDEMKENPEFLLHIVACRQQDSRERESRELLLSEYSQLVKEVTRKMSDKKRGDYSKRMEQLEIERLSTGSS